MVISEDTRKRLVAFLYQIYKEDTTCVELNELLDRLEKGE